MSEKDKNHLSHSATGITLALVNQVRQGKRLAVTFISDGKGNLIETHTGKTILQEYEKK